jgi:hypothetical protein
MRYDLGDSAQHLNELERQAWIRGEPTAPLLAALADRAEEVEGEPDRIEKAFEDGKAKGVGELREALRPWLDELHGMAIAKGRVTKAEVKVLFDQIDNLVEGFE